MARFVLHSSGGHYSFTLHVSSGDKIASSPPFITKSSAQQAINETRVASASAHLFRKCESGGQYYFELYSASEKLLLVSEKHWSEDSRDYGIIQVRTEGAVAHFTEMVF